MKISANTSQECLAPDVFAGIANEETRGKFGLHSSDFQLTESIVPQMAAVFAQFAVDYLENGFDA